MQRVKQIVHQLYFLIKHELHSLWLPLFKQQLSLRGIIHFNGSNTHFQAAVLFYQPLPELEIDWLWEKKMAQQELNRAFSGSWTWFLVTADSTSVISGTVS